MRLRSTFARLEAPTGVVDRQIGQLQAQLGVRVQPKAERILDHTRDEGRRFTGRQTFFGLPGELRLLHFHRQDEGNAFPDVFRGQLHTTRQQVAELAELAHGIQQALTQTVHVGAALRGRDQVDVAFLNAVAPSGSQSNAQSTASLLPVKLPQKGSSGRRRNSVTESCR